MDKIWAKKYPPKKEKRRRSRLKDDFVHHYVQTLPDSLCEGRVVKEDSTSNSSNDFIPSSQPQQASAQGSQQTSGQACSQVPDTSRMDAERKFFKSKFRTF